MTNAALRRRPLAELLGSAFLAAVVIGSGIAAQRLSPGATGLELLENGAASTAGLLAIILMFGPVPGGHFNPVVSFVDGGMGGAVAANRTAPAAVGAYIGVAYFFTSSTNPAITIGRMFAVIRAIYPGVTAADAADIMVLTHRDQNGDETTPSPDQQVSADWRRPAAVRRPQ